MDKLNRCIFLIEDDDLLEKYNTISGWSEVRAGLFLMCQYVVIHSAAYLRLHHFWFAFGLCYNFQQEFQGVLYSNDEMKYDSESNE